MSEEANITPEELRARVEAAVSPEEFEGGEGMDGYENAANHAVKVLLAVASRDPASFKKALDTFRGDPYGRDIEALMTDEERSIVIEGNWGLTGFQWGWAVNTVAFLTEQPPVPNPALITINVKEEV